MNQDRTTPEQTNWPGVAAPPFTDTPIVPLVEELTPTPDAFETLLRLAWLPNPIFLDSAAELGSQGRCSFVSAAPVDFLRLTGREGKKPLDLLAEKMQVFRVEKLPELPSFQGGVAGVFSYELGSSLERLPKPRRDEFGFPSLAVGFYDWVIAFDHPQRRAWIISTGYPVVDRTKRRDRACERLRQVREWIRTPRLSDALTRIVAEPVLPLDHYAIPGMPGITSSFDRPGYLHAVRRAIDYVHAGDCFQVNLAQRLLAPLTDSPLDLYRKLRERNPTAFAGYFDLGDFCVLSASPERFVRVVGDEVETRPIKGTRPRGTTPADDVQLSTDLLKSAKDRAENVMIVDLLRNDLGRVCRYGSVTVPTVCALESNRFVHHLVSAVRGRLRPGLGPIELLKASFPGGSVTGAPKIRAMEIIAELEPTARGAYCGCLGYLGFDGSMDTNILIRSFTAGRGWLQFPVGGGIVADSDPEREYAETWHKAEGLFRALRP